MSKRHKKKHNGNQSEKKDTEPVKPAEPKTDWFGIVVPLLISFGLAIVIVNNEARAVIIGAWFCIAIALSWIAHKLWQGLRWAVWKKYASVILLAAVFIFLAHANIRERLRPSFVFVSPGVLLNNDTWYMIENHRGPKTSYNGQILFTDVDRLDFLRLSQQSFSDADTRSYTVLIPFSEVNPMGRGNIFAQHFLWKPFTLSHSHFTADITWRDGGVTEELEIANVQDKWVDSIKVRDRETGKELLRCHDEKFPSSEAAPPCFPDVTQPGN
jgi:hypothetical protein